MPPLSNKLTEERRKNIRVLANFISIFCGEKHSDIAKAPFFFKGIDVNQLGGPDELKLCEDCGKLLAHAVVKLLLCPYDPKPKCKHCKTHCYAPLYRDKIKAVMRFSGLHLLKRGMVDLLAHYFL